MIFLLLQYFLRLKIKTSIVEDDVIENSETRSFFVVKKSQFDERKGSVMNVSRRNTVMDKLPKESDTPKLGRSEYPA